MALSNRDRVGRAFEALATGLEPYIDRRMRTTSRNGAEWLPAFVASARPPINGEVSLGDPSFQLRVMTEVWDTAFRSELTKSDRNLVFELRDVRNKWAHNDSFTVSDTYRALDSIERILVSVDAREADDVGLSKEDLMRLKYEAQARKATPVADVLISAPAAGLKPWREVIQPHDDVARGKFQIAEFAADLHLVSRQEGLPEYRDPIPFFERTFLTTGLQHLLGQAVERLTGEGATPIVDLQTSFGGGKTHSMIALYHLFSGTPVAQLPQDVHDLVVALGVTELPSVRRAVLVGTKLPPGQAWTKPDGTEVGTLWGELAWQLGGAEGYAMLAEADRTRTSPGDELRTLLERYAPCLVLIDEWVAYARGLYADDTLRGGTFDTHFSFAQALTEAVRATPNALLVVSIPASETPEGGPSIGSDIEVGGVGGREALRRLRVVIGRMESSWRPATAEESFEIVRRRLFQPIDSTLLPARDATARVFGEFYLSQRAEFPPECREPSYADRIKHAYPVHPELFARLYEDWSTLDRFQRTRGVLRLMAQVIHALWASGDQSPLILPASVPLADVEVVSELTRNLDDSWKPIIDTDIDGEHSLPRALDDEFKNLGRYLATRRVARTVFMGTAPRAGSPNQGIDVARVRLGCALPGETVAIYADALNRLADRATYLYAGNGRYWYGTQPGVARLARDRADRLLDGDRHVIRDHVVGRLRTLNDASGRGDFAAVHIAPAGPGDVADVAEARLVVFGLDDDHSRTGDSRALAAAQGILDSRGNAPRDYRNMLSFLAADQRRVDDLEQAVAEYLAWAEIVEESGPLNLDQHQESQARDRCEDADRTVKLRVADAYQVLLVPRQPDPTGPIEWDMVKADGQGELAVRAGEKLKHGGALYVDYPPLLLRMRLDGPLAPMWESGFTTVNDVWDAYARYVYLDRLRDIDTLCRCVSDAPASLNWVQEGVGVAELRDERTGDFAGLVGGSRAGSVRGTTLLVPPVLATAQIARQREAPDEAPDHENGESGSEPQTDTTLRRFYGTATVDPERLGRDAGRIAAEVVAHLTALVDSETEITIEIKSTSETGFPDDVVRIVTENAAALRFREHGFERQ